MKHFIYLFATLIVLISCKGNTSKSQEKEQQTAETTVSQSETQLAQAIEPLEKFKLLNQIAREKAKTLSAEDFGPYFMQFKEQVEEVMREIYAKESENQPDPEAWAKERGKIYTDAGLKYEMGEGMVYGVQPQDDYFLKNFGEYLPQDYKDFFQIKEEESNNYYGITAFGGYREELAGYILKYEDFISHHPQSRLMSEAKKSYNYYQEVYLLGLEDSPSIDDNGNLLPEAKAEFNRLIKERPNSKTAKLAKVIMSAKKNDITETGKWLKNEQKH